MNTDNMYAVGSTGGKLVPMMPVGPMTHEEAMNLAAWLVAMNKHTREEFLALLDEIEGL